LEDNIKIYFKDTRPVSVDCIQLAQGRVQWRDLVSMAIKFRLP